MEPLSGALAGVLGEVLRRAPNAPGKIECAWKASVGPAMDRGTRVRIEGVTLIVEAVSPEWRREVIRSSRTILARLQRLLGPQAIQDVIIRD
jgi:transposase InsO family protein